MFSEVSDLQMIWVEHKRIGLFVLVFQQVIATTLNVCCFEPFQCQTHCKNGSSPDRFNFFAMQLNSPFLGPFFFFCYTISVAYVLINMFLTILNESFAYVRDEVEKFDNDYEMVEFIIKKFKVGEVTDSSCGKTLHQQKRVEARHPVTGSLFFQMWTGIQRGNSNVVKKAENDAAAGDDEEEQGPSGVVDAAAAGGASGAQPLVPERAFQRSAPQPMDVFPARIERLFNNISKVRSDSDRDFI